MNLKERKVLGISQVLYVSIPAKVARQLGIKKGDKVAVIADDRTITIVPEMKQG